MYALPDSMEQRFKLYLNILPVVEQSAMYLLFASGIIFIVLTIYRLTFRIMFKSLNNKNQRNFVISDLWIEKEKTRVDKDGIYAPCEIPLSDTDTDDPQFDSERRPSLLKTHSDRIKELSHRLSDKVYDSVGSMKDKVRDFNHVKNIFNNEQKDSLISPDDSLTNDAFKSDSSDTEKDYNGSYHKVRQTDSDDDCKYLEVIDDGSEFDGNSTITVDSNRAQNLKELDSSTKDIILHISG